MMTRTDTTDSFSNYYRVSLGPLDSGLTIPFGKESWEIVQSLPTSESKTEDTEKHRFRIRPGVPRHPQDTPSLTSNLLVLLF